VRDSHEYAIDRAGLLAILAIVVGAGVLKALQHTHKQRMRQVRHDVQRVHLQYGLQLLGRDEIVRDEPGQIHLQRRAVGVLKVALIASAQLSDQGDAR